MARSGFSTFNTVRAASKHAPLRRTHSHESDGPGYPSPGSSGFTRQPEHSCPPAGEGALHRVGVRELPSGVYQEASQVFQLKGCPAAHNCALPFSRQRDWALIKDQRKGSQCPVSAIKAALTYRGGARREWASASDAYLSFDILSRQRSRTFVGGRPIDVSLSAVRTPA